MKYKSEIIINKLKKPLYNFIIYIKIDSIKLKDNIIYIKELKDDRNLDLEFSIPPEIKPGIREVRVCFEMYDEQRTFFKDGNDITKEKHIKSGLWTWFDYRIKWYHENIFRIKLK